MPQRKTYYGSTRQFDRQIPESQPFQDEVLKERFVRGFEWLAYPNDRNVRLGSDRAILAGMPTRPLYA